MNPRRVLLQLAVAFLMLPVHQHVAAAPAAQPPPVRIEAVSHNVSAPVGVGGRITVGLRGTGGGSATFRITGVAADIGMRELRSASYQGLSVLYTGTYVVQAGDGARNVAVFATLTVRGTEAMAVSPRPVMIDGRPPVITARQPKPGARLANARPNITVDLVDMESGVNPASARLLVNGRNVTARAAISETSIAYNPETPFRPGPVRVELTVADRARNTLRAEWTFQVVAPTGLITSVTINPASALTRDDVLTVVMVGAPGGRASFAVEGVRGEVAMRESGTKGTYFGTLRVRPEHTVIDAPLTVTLEKDGRKSVARAAALITMLGSPPAPPTAAIPNSSAAFEDPDARLIVDGSARPGSRILGRVTYAIQSPGFEAQGVLAEFLTIATPNGRWRASLRPLVPFERGRLTLTLVAIDRAGQRSPPVTVEVNSS